MTDKPLEPQEATAKPKSLSDALPPLDQAARLTLLEMQHRADVETIHDLQALLAEARREMMSNR